MLTPLTFAEYERRARHTDVAKGDKVIPLLGLAGEVGSLLSEHKKYLREGARYTVFTDQVSEELGDILWYLANIASKSGLSLTEIAEENLAKLEVNAPAGQSTGKVKALGRTRWYDDGYPPKERLPRKIRVVFEEVMEGGNPKLQISMNGKQLGQSLTDNAHYTDGYRFHDVFHLSYAVLLGWSPISRRLFDAKRRSKPAIDEIQDGGRAGVTEEGISALIFAHAAEHSYFEDAQSVDYDLLKAVRMMCRPFEVRDRTPAEWEQVILSSFTVWREVNRNCGGVLIGDGIKGTVSYEGNSRRRKLAAPRGSRRSKNPRSRDRSGN